MSSIYCILPILKIFAISYAWCGICYFKYYMNYVTFSETYTAFGIVSYIKYIITIPSIDYSIGYIPPHWSYKETEFIYIPGCDLRYISLEHKLQLRIQHWICTYFIYYVINIYKCLYVYTLVIKICAIKQHLFIFICSLI